MSVPPLVRLVNNKMLTQYNKLEIVPRRFFIILWGFNFIFKSMQNYLVIIYLNPN